MIVYCACAEASIGERYTMNAKTRVKAGRWMRARQASAKQQSSSHGRITFVCHFNTSNHTTIVAPSSCSVQLQYSTPIQIHTTVEEIHKHHEPYAHRARPSPPSLELAPTHHPSCLGVSQTSETLQMQALR
jgi:hypothetical protein